VPAPASRSYPQARCRRCTGSAVQPGDLHFKHFLAGWGQARPGAACSAPSPAPPCVGGHQPRASTPSGVLGNDRPLRCHHALRAATVWRLFNQERLATSRCPCARSAARVSRLIRGDRSGAVAPWGSPSATATGQTANHPALAAIRPRQKVKSLDGPSAARLSRPDHRRRRACREDTAEVTLCALGADGPAGCQGYKRGRQVLSGRRRQSFIVAATSCVRRRRRVSHLYVGPRPTKRLQILRHRISARSSLESACCWKHDRRGGRRGAKPPIRSGSRFPRPLCCWWRASSARRALPSRSPSICTPALPFKRIRRVER